MDTPPQVIHQLQMLFPTGIEHLQHDLLLEATQQFSTGYLQFFLINLAMLLMQTFTQLFFVEALVLFSPLHHRQVEIKLGLEMLLQTLQVPLFRQALRRHEIVDGEFKNLIPNPQHVLGHIFSSEDLVALVIDDPTLVVGHVIVFKQLFTYIEVTAFDLLLRPFYGVRHHLVLNSLTTLQTQRFHHALYTIRAEQPHQTVYNGEEETCRARIPLTSGTPT